MRVLLYILAILVLFTHAVFAQRQSVRTRQVQALGEPLYADAIIIPRSDSDSADVHVGLRFNKASFVFSKVNSIQEQRGNYYSVIALSIEARDAVGVVRQRVRFADTVFVNSYEGLTDSVEFHRGDVLLSLAAGQYTITVESINSRESQQRRIVLPKTHIPKREQRSNITISAVFTQAVNQEYDLLRPCIFNGNMPFPAGRMAVVAIVPTTSSASYDVWMRQLPYQEGDIRWWSGVDIHTTASNRGAGIQQRPDGLLNVASVEQQSRCLVIPINASDVVPGRYMMTLVPSGTKDTLRSSFVVEWESMPLSLRSLSYALDVLAYICPEETLDSLRDGNEADQREKLMEWWRRQDKTVETANNEYMAEYYRRVDKASYAYATLIEPDGAFTDRGKVYILFGAPTKIDRKTDRDGDQVETWIYTNSVRRVFVFKVEDAGSYRLTTIQQLKK